jgi:microsomal dipeptidase-like Zn-dependent dipeptidase
MIADLHCHYPMHLLPEELAQAKQPRTRLQTAAADGRRLFNKLLAFVLVTASDLVNDATWGEWRVDLDGLEKGGAGVVCSVLYSPVAEFDLPHLNDSPPLEEDYERITTQLEAIEEGLPDSQNGTPVFFAKTVADLERPGMRFVHCVEGGFQLGSDEEKIDERVKWLADRGVLYITVAHLFYRQVATEAPAIPHLSDRMFLKLLPERGESLTPFGRTLIKAMYRHKVLIDISHMSERAVQATFDIVERLDAEEDRDPSLYPIIAGHVGMRSVNKETQAQEYDLSDEIAVKIAEREGVIGLIMAQHQLGKVEGEPASAKLVKQHLEAIGRAVSEDGDASEVAALGTDIDGFIKPTLDGFENAPDFKNLEQWVRNAGQRNPDAILHGNAERVIRAAFAGRPAPIRIPKAPVPPPTVAPVIPPRARRRRLR